MKNSPTQKLLDAPHVKELFDIFSQNGIEAYIVGGAVRDALLSHPIYDIDIAVSCSPEKVEKILKDVAIIKPTGLSFGTVTAIFPKNHFQITSFRKDIETDGRRAKVIFGGTLREDAQRRDFTINALYLSGKGEIIDFFEGEKDLKEGRVRFIGEPKERIREDYLRILRFFRMGAYFAKLPLDQDALDACTQLKKRLSSLSRERIRSEFFKLLAGLMVEPILEIMDQLGILEEIKKGADLTSFKHLMEKEEKERLDPFALRRLRSLYPQVEIKTLTTDFVLSRKETSHLQKIQKAFDEKKSLLSILYHEGKEVVRDFVLLHDEGDITPAMQAINHFIRPSFPIKASDLMEKGFSGKELGNILKHLEKLWVEKEFQATRKDLLKSLDELQ